MACKTCGHTMQRVNDGMPPVFWCPRCGTLKMERSVPEFERPKIVDHAFKLCQIVRSKALADLIATDAAIDQDELRRVIENRTANLADCCLSIPEPSDVIGEGEPRGE